MNGYLYVASRDERYLKAACQSAESLLEFHPKAKITLFTEDRWEGTYDKTLFDNVFSCDVVNRRHSIEGAVEDFWVCTH